MLVTDKLLSGDDDNDTGDTRCTLISKHLTLAAIESVNNSAKGILTLAFMFQCKCVSACFFCVRSAFRCKLSKQCFDMGVRKQLPSCQLSA